MLSMQCEIIPIVETPNTKRNDKQKCVLTQNYLSFIPSKNASIISNSMEMLEKRLLDMTDTSTRLCISVLNGNQFVML